MGNKYTKNKTIKNINEICKDYETIFKNRDEEHCKKKNYLKDFINDNNKIPIMDRLNDLFGKGFRCNKCLSLLRLKINDSKNERGELLIEGKCRKNHIVTKSIKEILKTKGLIKFSDNFKIVDNFYNNRKKDFDDNDLFRTIKFYNDPIFKSNFCVQYLTDEEENYYYYFISSYKNKNNYKKENFYICNECKIIYYDEVEEFNHEHPTYKFNYKGNVYDGKSTIYNLEIKSRKKFENKINSQIYYYENLKNIITKNKLKTAKQYLDIISDEISLIKEINNNYIEKKSQYNYDNYISIIENINLIKFDVEKYKNYLTKELILKITDLNNQLEKNENIKYQNSGPASLSNYKIITIEGDMYDICILNKDYFIITFEKDLIKVYKKEFSIKENKPNLINIFTSESKAIKIVKLNDNRIAGTNSSNDNIIYIYSFNNNFTSFNLEKEIIITDMERFEMIKFKQFLVLKDDTKIKFYKEINKNEFQLIISMAFNGIKNILEINNSLFLFIKKHQLFFYSQIKFNKVYESDNLKISKASLLKNNLLGICKDGTLYLEFEIMNIKTKEIIFRLKEKCDIKILVVGMLKVEQMISLNEDNILIAKQIRNGAGGRYYYMTELVEYIKINDNNYIKGNKIDINRFTPIKINFIGNCFFYFTFDSFKLFYPEFNN